MNDENRINWNEVKAYLKAANVTEATNMGIYTNPMPQHQGGQVTTQRLTPVQTNPGPSASVLTSQIGSEIPRCSEPEHC